MTSNHSIGVEISSNIAMDIEQLTNGGFNPLSTFMNFEELELVLQKMQLPTGELWPIPILFPKPKTISISKNDSLLLKYKDQKIARLDVSDIFEYDLKKLIRSFYGTDDVNHPGVIETKKNSNKFLTGRLTKIRNLSDMLNIPAKDPMQIKKIIKEKNWKKIVGFHTRNPPHRAHEYIQKCSLENVDGILIHPVIGTKKDGDFSNDAIINSYKCYIEKFLPKKNVIFSPLLTYSRYAGPKEAVFTALVRRNYGCTHFIVGRDHTGVKDFYGKYDSQKIFKNLKNVGIEILCFDEPYYCKKCNQITTSKTCPHDKNSRVEISGTIIRQAISNKSNLPEYYIRKEILEELQNTQNIFVTNNN